MYLEYQEYCNTVWCLCLLLCVCRIVFVVGGDTQSSEFYCKVDDLRYVTCRCSPYLGCTPDSLV